MSTNPLPNFSEYKRLHSSLPAKIPFEKLKPLLKNPERIKNYEAVFNFLDKMDNYKYINNTIIDHSQSVTDGFIDMRAFKMDAPLEFLFTQKDGAKNTQQYIDHYNLDFTVDDMNDFLRTLTQFVDSDEIAKLCSEQSEEEAQLHRVQFSEYDLPDNVKDLMNQNSTVSVVEVNGKQLYKVSTKGAPTPDEFDRRPEYYYDTEILCDKTKIIQEKTLKYERNIYDETYPLVSETISSDFDEYGDPKIEIEKLSSGLTITKNKNDKTVTTTMNNNTEVREDDFIDKLILNKGNDALQVSIKLVYDQNTGEITDLEMRNNNKLPIVFENKNELLKMFNKHDGNDKMFFDYNLKVDIKDNQQIITIIKKNTSYDSDI